MRLLVTRPEPDAVETAERLELLGHQALLSPLLRIVFCTPPADVADPAAIILTSRNGARALATWPQARGWLDRPLLVVGYASADIVRRAGFRDIRIAGGNAAALAHLLMSQFDKDVGPILYPAARDRAGSLASDLALSGYSVDLVEAYRAEIAERLDPGIRVAIMSSSVDGALYYSYRTALAFRAIAEREGIVDRLLTMMHFAISNRVAVPFRDLGADVRVAHNPDEESLFALLPKSGG